MTVTHEYDDTTFDGKKRLMTETAESLSEGLWRLTRLAGLGIHFDETGELGQLLLKLVPQIQQRIKLVDVTSAMLQMTEDEQKEWHPSFIIPDRSSGLKIKEGGETW